MQAFHVHLLAAQLEKRFLRLLGGGAYCDEVQKVNTSSGPGVKGNTNQGVVRGKRTGRKTMEDTDDDEPIFMRRCCDGGAGGGEHGGGGKSEAGDNAAAASGRAMQATPPGLPRAGSVQGADDDNDDDAPLWPEGFPCIAGSRQAEAAVGSLPASKSPLLSPRADAETAHADSANIRLETAFLQTRSPLISLLV